MASNRLQDNMVAGLRAVVSAADELTYAPDIDSLFRQAVEFARDKLGVERCGISLPVGDFLQGTFGTNLRGETTDERKIQFAPNQQWFESIDALQRQGEHYTTIEGIRQDWDGEALQEINRGWIVLTPIRSAQNLIGVFFNDSAISGSPLDPNTQEILSVFCSLLGNMVERKRAEKALAEERNLLRTVIDNIPDYIYVKDMDARLLLSNLALTQLTGFDSPESLVGKTNTDLFSPELAAHYTADDHAVTSSGQPLRNREEIAIDPNGNPFWLLTSKMPLINQQGEVTGLLGISRDISELKRSQIALEKSNNELEMRIQERVAELERVKQTLVEERTLLRTLIDTLPDYIFIKDLQGRFVMSNKAHALAANVLDPDEFIGKQASVFFPADLASQYDEDDRVVVQTGQSLINLERMTLDANHHSIHVSTTKVPLRDANGNIVGVVGISRDITAFKYAQEALKQQERFLRQVIDANPSRIFVKDREGQIHSRQQSPC